MWQRREFLLGVTAAGAAAMVARGQDPAEKPKPLDPELVNRFVGRSHADLAAVTEMLKEEPRLVHASWDWGRGDWETGLGAAAHTGRREIAELLLENGARVDTFAAAMLGLKPLVESLLEAFPKIHAVPGPHGIPLLSHAVVGREAADEVLVLLLDRGADVNGAANMGQTPLMMAAGLGRIDTVKLLLARGADRTLKDSRGQTALDAARKREHAEVAALLEK